MLWVLGLAWGNPLDAWGPHVGHGILALNPNVFVSTDETVEVQGIVGVGLTPTVDVQLATASAWDPSTSPGPLEVLPRWFPVEGVGVVLHGLWEPGMVRVGPELHLTQPTPVGLDVYLDGGGSWGWWDDRSGPAQAFVVAGLEWTRLPVHPYVETHTEALVDETPTVYVTPGVFVPLGDDGRHEISTGVRLPAYGGAPAVLGAWYNANIDLRR